MDFYNRTMTQRTATYFISDIHLGAGYISDRKAHEQKIVDWLRGIAPTAKALYLLGDILDYWYEYRTVVPRGYIRFFGALAELADSGVEITWLKGNHDIWIFDYLPNEIGLTIADGVIRREIDNKIFVMEHGDGIGEPRRSYRRMRKLFRNRIAQILYTAIHPRWTVGFAHRWSKHSRLQGHSTHHTVLTDNDPMTKFAHDYTEQNGHVDYFIFAHRHIEVNREIGPDSRLIVLGDAFHQMTYGVWDGNSFRLKKIGKPIENAKV